MMHESAVKVNMQMHSLWLLSGNGDSDDDDDDDATAVWLPSFATTNPT